MSKIPVLHADGYHDDLFGLSSALINLPVVVDGQIILPGKSIDVRGRAIFLECEGAVLVDVNGRSVASRMAPGFSDPTSNMVAPLRLNAERSVLFSFQLIRFSKQLN